MIKVSPKSNGRIRFNVFGKKGFVAVRVTKSRGWKLERQATFNQLHLGKVSIALEKRRPKRKLYEFAG